MTKLYYRYGAMNSGKTRDLIKTYYNYKEKNMNVLIIKPACDKKGDDKVISRDQSSIKTDYLIKEEDNIYNIIEEYLQKKNLNCVLVDESQFLSPHHILELSDIVDNLDIPVICYGLRSDFLTNLFPGSSRLFALADNIEEIKTICQCGKKAIINLRYVDGKPIFAGEQVAIDGQGQVTYESYCRRCAKEIIKKEKVIQ